MKRLLPAFVLLLILASLLVLPAAVSAVDHEDYYATSVTTLPATGITPNSATLNASIIWQQFTMMNEGTGRLRPVSDTSGMQLAGVLLPPTGNFRYGTSPTALTSSTAQVIVARGADSFSTNIVGLFPCTTYYVQAFFVTPLLIDYEDASPADYMVALFSSGEKDGLSGLGVGLNRFNAIGLSNTSTGYRLLSGAVLSFTTPGCATTTTPHGTGVTGFGGTSGISNIGVHTAAISSTRVGPGEKVEITATVANKGTANGAAKVTLFINGQEVESKGLTLASGQSEPVHFFVSENEPGTYSVQVGGVSAGSFTVDTFNNNDILIYGVIALFTLGIAGAIFMLTRKRTA